MRQGNGSGEAIAVRETEKCPWRMRSNPVVAEDQKSQQETACVVLFQEVKVVTLHKT